MTAEAFAEMFRHNLWANLRLLDFCAGRDDETLAAGAAGAYGSARDTLVHTLAAEARYVAMLSDREPAADIHEEKPFPGFDALRESARASGEALIAMAEAFDQTKTVSGEYKGQPYTMPAVYPMVQAINHATEHRTNVTTILAARGVQPPGVDGWAYARSRLRDS